MNPVEYPRPVLQPNGSDYLENCAFQIVFNAERAKVEDEEIVLTVGYELVSSGLKDMLAKGDAEACVVAHSPAASYRRLFLFEKDKTTRTIRINKFDVIDKIELTCIIVSSKQNESFSLDDFNHIFFKNVFFKIRRGDLLGITQKITIPLDSSDLEKPVASIFRINKVGGQEAPILPDFNSPSGKIEINLSESLYKQYTDIEQGYAKSFRRCLTCAVVLPTLVEAIETLRNEYDEYIDFRWARTIDAKLKQKSLDIQNSEEPSTQLANLLLGNIIEDSLNAFKDVIEERSEEYVPMGGVD